MYEYMHIRVKTPSQNCLKTPVSEDTISRHRFRTLKTVSEDGILRRRLKTASQDGVLRYCLKTASQDGVLRRHLQTASEDGI